MACSFQEPRTSGSRLDWKQALWSSGLTPPARLACWHLQYRFHGSRDGVLVPGTQNLRFQARLEAGSVELRPDPSSSLSLLAPPVQIGRASCRAGLHEGG